jgi:hypothetical protein
MTNDKPNNHRRCMMKPTIMSISLTELGAIFYQAKGLTLNKAEKRLHTRYESIAAMETLLGDINVISDLDRKHMIIPQEEERVFLNLKARVMRTFPYRKLISDYRLEVAQLL